MTDFPAATKEYFHYKLLFNHARSTAKESSIKINICTVVGPP